MQQVLTMAWRGLAWRAFVLVLAMMGCAQAQDFLPPEQAFALSSPMPHDGAVELRWQIAKGYYLYRERLQLHGESGQSVALTKPAGQAKFDPNFNRVMEVYHDQLVLGVAAEQLSGGKSLVVEYQGCAEMGLCYPPQFVKLNLTGDKTAVRLKSVDQPNASLAASATSPPTADPSRPSGATDMIATTLANGNLLKTAAVFWVAGLLLAFTPCVLPMVPILSTLIAGQSGPVSRRRGFALALAYVVGMAIVYAGMGMAAGLAGEGLAAALQNPWVLGSFAVMLGGLALGMFGLYELQMPSFIQNQAIGWSNRFRGGSFAGVFIMGGLSALILGPCVAAPLAGALVFISQTRDLVIGGTALFFMGLGMGMPLLLVGMSAGSLLPRTGAWMELVKHMFGLLLVATAVWIISPVLPIPMQMLLWSACLLGAAYVFGGVFARTQPSALRLVGMACAALAVVFLIGAASGGQSLLQPLAHLQARASSGTSASALGAAHGLPFTRIHSTQELDAALAQAGTQNRTVMLDFYADWCVACKEFESFTFSDPKVRGRIATGGLQLLQADVTANNAQDKALLKRFALFGPPAIVFLTGRQPQRVAHQVVGYQNAQEFLLSLDRVIAP